MIIVTVFLGVNRKQDKKARKKNDTEHKVFMRNLDAITKVLRKIETSLQTSEQDVKKTYNLVFSKISPLMEKESLIKELQKRISEEEEKFSKERKLIVALATKLEKANKQLKEFQESDQKEKKEQM